ncbi:MAG: magnesium transporter [Oscillospiraceae bacterium]|nr:magnesium transporter [Oscillospiraceae bacterium]
MNNQTFEFEEHSDYLRLLLSEKNAGELRLQLNEMEDFDVAVFLTDLREDGEQLMVLTYLMLSKEKAASVFAELEPPEQELIINSISDAQLGAIIEEMYVDDAVDLMEELPANVVRRVMRTAKPETRKLINQYLKYPENSAGSIMTAEFVDLKKYMSVKESIARIRRIGDDKETIYVCYVTSADRKLEGVVTVKDLLLHDDDDIIEDIMSTNVICTHTRADQEEVVSIISDYDMLAIPVVDGENRLVGIITVDDVIDVIEEENTEDIEMMAGILPMDTPYARSPVVEIWKSRMPWLLILMLSATMTQMVITSFEDALAAQAVLTAFIPMLMGTGGNSGSQAPTAVIRSLSLGETEPSDVLKVVWREIRVAVLCGITLAAVNFVKLMLVDRILLHNPDVTTAVALTICLTMVFIVMFAKTVGCTLPLLAEKIGLDPAVMAAPLITTLTDTVSLLIFFQFARMILHL